MSFFKYKIPYDLDSSERTIFHQHLISGKPFLKKIYIEWYKEFIKSIPALPEGKLVELGSGGGFLKKLCPSVICSDFLPLPANDMTFSALDMPFSENEISGIFMVDSFHHIPDSGKFLHEASRVLKKDGQIIMIEPANSRWGRLIYKNFHHEPFVTTSDWLIPDKGPLSGANGALPWIVFERDMAIFKNLFPCFEVISIKYHTPLRYLISGGVSYRQLMPGFLFAPFTVLDKMLSSISKQISMFVTIKIKKVT
ncbi:MAG: class I SAM-dependent methyltransferase [Bacteroidales bacterium]